LTNKTQMQCKQRNKSKFEIKILCICIALCRHDQRSVQSRSILIMYWVIRSFQNFIRFKYFIGYSQWLGCSSLAAVLIIHFVEDNRHLDSIRVTVTIVRMSQNFKSTNSCNLMRWPDAIYVPGQCPVQLGLKLITCGTKQSKKTWRKKLFYQASNGQTARHEVAGP
jgi:hypothetical protein